MPMNEQQIGALLNMAVACQPQRQNLDMGATVLAWLLTLGHLEYATAQAALVRVLQASPFFPVPADILAAATRLTELAELRQMAEATEAALRLAGEWVDPPRIEAREVIPGGAINPGVLEIMRKHRLLPAPHASATGEGAA